MKKKIDLSPELKKPLDVGNLANDEGTLRILAGELNKGARVAKDTPVVVDTTRYSGPTGEGNTTLLTDSMPTAQEQAAQNAAMRPTKQVGDPTILTPTDRDASTAFSAAIKSPPPTKSRRLVFTGRHLSALAQQLGATHYSLTDGATALAELFLTDGVTFDTPGVKDFITKLIAWGNSEWSNEQPFTVERLTLTRAIRELPGYAQFGTGKAFWTDNLVEAAKEQPEDTLIVFTGIADITALNYFKALGFSHWHVTGPANAVVDPLSKQCDQDVIRALSKDRQGPKLRVIWSPETPNPSPRLWSTQEFLASFK